MKYSLSPGLYLIEDGNHRCHRPAVSRYERSVIAASAKTPANLEKIGASAAIFTNDSEDSQLGLQRAIQQCAAQLSTLDHAPVLQKS
jgi:hypothetical protein